MFERKENHADYTISQAVIVRKENGKLPVMDGFVNGAATGDDTAAGSLIGILFEPDEARKKSSTQFANEVRQPILNTKNRLPQYLFSP